MPRAKTGCSYVCYLRVSRVSLVILDKLAKEQGASRSLYMDAALKKMAEYKNFVTVEKPVYYPHEKMRQRTSLKQK